MTESEPISESALIQLRLFRRQYLQLLDLRHLTWPSSDYLRKSDVQEWLYESCFLDSDSNVLPPESYRLRVLKPLLAQIEQSIVDPEEDVSLCLCFRTMAINILSPLISSISLYSDHFSPYIGNIRQSHVYSS